MEISFEDLLKRLHPSCKVAVVGTRDASPTFSLVVNQYLQQILNVDPDVTFISGGAKGIDTMVKNFAKTHNVNYIEYPAEWRLYGKRAGVMRNTKIVNEAEFILAFITPNSKGTKDTVQKGLKKGIPVVMIRVPESALLNTSQINYEG